MKKSDKKILHDKTYAELQKMLIDARQAFRDLRFDLEQFKVKNTRSLYNKRKEIAVVQTMMQLKGREEKNG
jgi:ribosomal protein L29